MKKHVLFLLSLFFAICFLIFACRRNIDNFIGNKQQAEVSSPILESAKIWNSQIIAMNSKATKNVAGFVRLKPQWQNAWSQSSAGGLTLLVVPTSENYVSNRQISIRRVFVFELVDNQIAEGRILEVVGLDKNQNLSSQLEGVIANYHQNTVPGFDGAVIEYDVNYRWMKGTRFNKGVKTSDNVVFSKWASTGSVLASKNTDVYLDLFTGDLNNKSITGQIFLYSSNKLRIMDAGSGSGSDINGGTLSEVTIPGGGGDYGGNPPPSGGGGGTPPGGNPSDPGSGSGSSGTTISLAYGGMNGAVLCGGINAYTVGASSTGGVKNLGFIMTIHSSDGTSEVIPCVWPEVCFEIPNYQPSLSTPSLAALKFETAYNAAVTAVIGEVSSGALPATTISIQLALKAQIILLLNAAQLGSTFSTGACAGQLSTTNATYCSM